MADVKKLKLYRAQFKSVITRTESFANDPITKTVATDLIEARKERLCQVFKEYERTQVEIESIDDADTEDFSLVEEKFLKSLSQLNAILKTRNIVPHIKVEDKPKNLSLSNLPDIDMPMYDGKDFTKFKPFYDLFIAIIHNNNSLPDIAKLCYLRKYLTDEALSVIINLPLEDLSYNQALELLNKRYNNKTRLVINHVNLLLDIQPMQRGTANSIRSFISQVQQQLFALKNMEQPIDSWDMLLIPILSRKLDQMTNRAYQLDRNSDNFPTIKEFISYLEKRAIALEDCLPPKNTSHEVKPSLARVANVAVKNSQCEFCGKNSHNVFECIEFKAASVAARQTFVTDKKLCSICLRNHKSKCKYSFKCKICKDKSHNTLLHSDDSGDQAISLLSSNASNKIILPTVKVFILDKYGRQLCVRALLDSGSQVCFIRSSLVDKLSLDCLQQSHNIIGITNVPTHLNKYVEASIKSCLYDITFKLKCHVVDSITMRLPQQFIDVKDFNIPNNITLSDEDFNKPSHIDLLLSADIYFDALMDGHVKLTSGPVLQNTVFGYVMGGKCIAKNENSCNNLVTNFALSESSNLENIFQRFWLSEKLPEVELSTSEEFERAENIFQETTVLKNNSFFVDIPLSQPVNLLNIGDSFSAAYQRFMSLERKFKSDNDLFLAYKNFIDNYVELGHAQIVDIGSYNLYNGNVHFLAHHAVHNESSKTTKLRVVFDGSMKGSTGISLNDVMLNGPVVQSELFDILITFRTYPFFILCDVEKAFRCVNINDKYKCLQNILWRDDPKKPISCLQLQTVTYGLKASTFLTTRCMIELASRYKQEFPLAALAMQKNTYVDDVISGGDDVEQIKKLKVELINLLKLGNFKLHKWCSNVSEVLDDLPDNRKSLEEVDLTKDNTVKTLGLKLDVNSDAFTFSCPSDTDFNSCNTKRMVLSFIGKMFDPLGLISPVVVVAKMFMQKLWSANLSWDSTLPENLLQEWLRYMSDLKGMGRLSTPRLANCNHFVKVELVGFADASFLAFGCCLYLRVFKSNGHVETNLFCSKTRVAPLNKSHTIPQLELNSALLLAKLASRVSNILLSRFQHRVFLYSDSQIVLSWISSKGTKGNIYVNNRVKQINQFSEQFLWLHVKGAENPADVLSRGSDPNKLRDNHLWWHGPQYLGDVNYTHLQEIPENITSDFETSDEGSEVHCLLSNVESNVFDILERYSDLNKLQRIISYIYRFYQNCKNPSNKNIEKYLTPKELTCALRKIILFTQQKHFANEFKLLRSGKSLKVGIANLNPFIDAEGILRVGGRLCNASLSYDKLHPMILPKSSHITTLLIQREHVRLLHAGAKLVLSSLSQKFWIVSAAREVKKVIHQCIRCARLKADSAKQLMGSLPSERVTSTRPFQHVGVDFCGPFHVKVSRLRNPLITKGYVALFVCFASKAIHLELVSNLTSEAFLACLQRFVSRRGLPTKIFCDNAQTFKGAANELKDLYNLFNSKTHFDNVNRFASNHLIQFSFIPSYSPEFGGLWEAGVKSFKTHFKRVVGNIKLTYEELNTIIVQIEGILNSRPLLPVSSELSELQYLTPGHFLIGAALETYPEIDLTDVSINRVKLWKICSKVKQHFWKAWTRDYLTSLQSRAKWASDCCNIKVGDLVIVKNLNTSPLDWPIAKVVKTFPGKDGKVRVAEVAMNNKIYTRSIVKLCPLPVESK